MVSERIKFRISGDRRERFHATRSRYKFRTISALIAYFLDQSLSAMAFNPFSVPDPKDVERCNHPPRRADSTVSEILQFRLSGGRLERFRAMQALYGFQSTSALIAYCIDYMFIARFVPTSQDIEKYNQPPRKFREPSPRLAAALAAERAEDGDQPAIEPSFAEYNDFLGFVSKGDL